jgi:glutamyl-tRNA reductase
VSVVVIGLNHRTAPLDLLERMSIDTARQPKALADLVSRSHLGEAVVLSTCNRTEVYAVAEKFHPGFSDVRDFLAEQSFLAPEDFSDHLYVHHAAAAAAHLFKVAAGLDSAVLGEHEVLGQVRTAWEVARSEGAAGARLNLLFRHALEVGKRIRTETAIGEGIASASAAAVALAAHHMAGWLTPAETTGASPLPPTGAPECDAPAPRLDHGLAGARVLVVGAGEMGEGLVVALTEAGASEVAVANRTPAHAEALAARVDGRALPLSELRGALADVDLLLTSTGAQTAILEHADLEEVLSARGGRPLLIIDIAVPRDVDPSAAALPGVTLLDMDDLRRFIERGLAGRRQEAERAAALVDEELDRYLVVAEARLAAPLVAALRDRAEGVRTTELARAAGRLGGLDARQRAAVEALTRGIVAKLLHEPTVRVKDAAGTPRGDRLAQTLRELFDL